MDKYLNYEGLSVFKDNIVTVIDKGDSVQQEINVELGEGGQLGGYKTGDTIAVDTPIETVIKKLLAKQIPPVYTQPTVALANNSGDKSGAYEYGSYVTPKVKATFTQNDAGELSSIKIKKGSTEVATGDSSPLTYTADESIQLTGTVTFTAVASYGEGDVKNDNLGDPYSEGHVEEGSVTSSNYSYTVYDQGYFWGILTTSSDEEELTSDIIRSGHMKNGAYAAGNIKETIAASEVANRKRIFVACPATKKGVTKIVMPSAQGADCTADFEKQSNTITVARANNTTGIAYNVWVYEPALISDDQTFIVTLG